MGRRWSRKRKAEDKKFKAQNAASNDGDTFHKKPKGEYRTAVQSNEMMEAYYAYQGLHDTRKGDKNPDGLVDFVPCANDEERKEEHEKFMASLRSILPASFRIGLDCPLLFREKFIKEIEEHAGKPMEIQVEDREKNVTTRTIEPARPIPYIPYGYQLSVDRRTIRRNPSLQSFHEWLKIQTDAGFITRQETVSMIPPVVLDIKPGHAVLDMCAAPGSKTTQMLEIVAHVAEGDREPTGFVVANDSDAKRAYMLVHQLRRINSPAIFVTACDAQFYPQLRPKGTTEKESKGSGMFDRVLCDVPCSGDGTTRKNPGTWKQWNLLGVLALHPLQLSIALTGARLTAVGGYMCYSTCSMNPIENEAVVAEILRLSEGSLELVDKHADMPTLASRPGWSSWKVMRSDKKRSGSNASGKDKGKNSPKMIQKRKEWEAKLAAEGDAKSAVLAEGAEISGTGGGSNENTMEVVAKETNEEVMSSGKTVELKDDNNKAQGNDTKKEDEEIKENGSLSKHWDQESLKQSAIASGLTPYDSFEDVPELWQRRVRKSCFPPTDDEVEKFHLDRCMRILPHDMDTGGFFIALLKKVAPIKSKTNEKIKDLVNEMNSNKTAQQKQEQSVMDEEVNTTTNEETVSADTELKGDDTSSQPNSEINVAAAKTSNVDISQGTGEESAASKTDESKSEQDKLSTGEESTASKTGEKIAEPEKVRRLFRGRNKPRGYLGNSDFIPISDDIWPELVKFYGFTDDFPKDQFMARACGDAKVIYFITKNVKTNLIENGIQRVTVINSGLKSFERNNKDCIVKYRVNQEGVHFTSPYMTKRKLVANPRDFSICLNSGAIWLGHFSTEFEKKLKELVTGSFVVILEGFVDNVTKKMCMAMWKCRGDSVNCLVSKGEMDGIKSKLRALDMLVQVVLPPKEESKTEEDNRDSKGPKEDSKIEEDNEEMKDADI